MKSFGIWYSNVNTQKVEEEPCEEKFSVDFHINLWDLGVNKSTEVKPFIDIGLSITAFRELDKIYFQIPFLVEREELIDLTDTFSETMIANLVFNDDCRFQRDSNNICSLELSEDIGNFRLLYKLSEAVIEWDENFGTSIIFDLETIRNDAAYNAYKDVYIRFRIQSNKIKEELFCKINRKNWFLESGFNETKIIDIKVNKKRNMSEENLKIMRRNNYRFVDFRKIHFLVMEPANNDVEVLGKDFIECRKLESEWGNYLKQESEIGDIIAYHWKAKEKDGSIKEYANMVKVTSATTTWRIIIVYILVVILIEVFTNMIFTYLLVPLFSCFLV